MNTTDKFLEDGVTPNPHYVAPKETDDERIERLAEEKAAAKLKDIKGKLDDAYGSRDKALAEAAEAKLARDKAHKEKLEAEGKTAELAALELKEAKEAAARLEAERDALKKQTTELTRDANLRAALGGLTFRNEKSSNMAYNEIVSDLVQDEQGQWKHKSGVSIRDYVAAYAKDEDNSFLFKVKGNSGGGSSNSEPAKSDSNTPLHKRSQKDVLADIASGKIKVRGQ